MKNRDTKYEYDPNRQTLTVIRGGKTIGGFVSQSAEREFSRLLESGAEINITDMSNSIKSARIKRLRAMWMKQGVDQYRDAILQPYGVTSTADLSLQQLDELIEKFNTLREASPRTRSLRSNVLVTLNRLGIYVDNGDWARVNEYLMNPRIAGKLMYQMTDDELIDLDRKLRSILKKNMAISAEVERQKLLN